MLATAMRSTVHTTSRYTTDPDRRFHFRDCVAQLEILKFACVRDTSDIF
jgi:hypothetical protein